MKIKQKNSWYNYKLKFNNLLKMLINLNNKKKIFREKRIKRKILLLINYKNKNSHIKRKYHR